MDAIRASAESEFSEQDSVAQDASAYDCPMPDIAKLIGGKWKLIILQILIFHGMKRFNELRRAIPGITQTMLTNQLRALEKDGLVHRKVYAEVPPRVEYTATPKACALTGMFKEMHKWWVTVGEGAVR